VTDPTPTPPPASPDPSNQAGRPAKRRGCFGLALKTTLGCAAFALGAFVVLILLLPTLVQSGARSFAESAFAESCKGTLAVGDLSLSWNKPVKIRDAVLYDPEKHEVARVSAELPSILGCIALAASSSKEPVRVHVDVDANLVADDQGVVNLQRAIELRPDGKVKTTVSKKTEEPSEKKSSSSPLDGLQNLDAEIVVASRRLSWSDADTRKRNQPFEIHGFHLEMRVKPGAPLTVHATGQVVSDAPGELSLDATLHGPIDAGRAWPFGDVDAAVTLGGFSTPMVDGVAGLGGKLTEVLGPRFDLKLTASGVTPEKGDLQLAFSSERSSLAFAGDFAGGVLRSKDAAPILLKVGVPRGFVNAAIASKLPPGTTAAWQETDKPWTVTVSNLELPVPDASAPGMAGTAKALEHLRCDVVVDLPARVALETPETKAAKVTAAVEGIHATFSAAPGAPAKLHLDTTIETAGKSPLVVEATVPDPWKSLAGGGVPPFDATVRVQDLATATIDALAAQGGRITGALGPAISVNADVHAEGDRRTVAAAVDSQRLKIGLKGSGDAATWLRSEGEDGLDLVWTPADGWIDHEAAAFLPPDTTVRVRPGPFEVHARNLVVPANATIDTAAADLSVRVPAISVASTSKDKKMPPADLDPITIDAKLAKGALNAAVRTGLAGGSAGRVTVQVAAPKLAATIAQAPGGAADVKLGLEGLSTAMLNVFAGQAGLVSGLLGPTLDVAGNAHVDGANVDGAVDVTSPTTKVHAAGKLAGGKLVASEALALSTAPTSKWLADRVAASLPPGSSVAFADETKPIEVKVTDVALPMPVALDALACTVTCKLPGLHYAGTDPQGAKTEANVRDLALSAELAPKKPLHANVQAAVDAGPTLGGGKLAADITVPDPWFFQRPNPPAIPPVDADVKLDGLPCASLDAIAKKPGLFTGLFGPTASLALGAKVASADAGTVNASFSSDGAKLSASAKLDKGTIVGASDPAVDFSATLTQAWLDAQAGSMVPKGAKLALADKTGALRLQVRDLSLPLPTGAPSAESLAKTSIRLTANVPDLSYTDAAGSPPATVRGLSIEANAAPGKPPEAKIAAKVEGTPPGDLSATVRALDPLTLLAQDKGPEKFHVAADVGAKSLPTGLVDALAGQGGLLVDVLGPHFDLKVHSDSISETDGTFTASLDSEKASVRCDHGSMKDKVFHLEKVQGKNEAVLASAQLTPLFSQKVIGSLVPALVNVQKPKPTDPVVVAVENLSMPMDADLSKLDALVRVNLGEVIAHPLPGLASLLGGKGGGGVNLNVPEIKVPIQKGVASYDGLPLPIGGKTYPMKGTFNLVDKSFKMQASIPLGMLGSGVNSKLDGARGVLDANTLVPIELSGTWQKPKVSVGEDFVKKVAEEALKKQGGNLLEGLFKKKK
jgi:hypothetical protein